MTRTAGPHLGFRKDGRPIYLIQGGAEGDPPADPAKVDPPADPAKVDPPADPAKVDPPKVDPPKGESIDDLPPWAQKLVKDTRAEAARDRTDGQTKAAEDARKKMVKDIAEALGITNKEASELTPAQLKKQLEETQSSKADSDRELSLYRVAGPLGVNADKLLDSRKFMATIASVDPKDQAKLKTAVEEALKVDPTLRSGSGQAPGSSSVDHSGRPGEFVAKKPKSLSDAISGSLATGK